jgi:hypothetical protein
MEDNIAKVGYVEGTCVFKNIPVGIGNPRLEGEVFILPPFAFKSQSTGSGPLLLLGFSSVNMQRDIDLGTVRAHNRHR